MEEFKSWDQLSELEQLESIYCDLHKDVYGVKAHWYKADSVEQARKDLDALQVTGEAIWAAERERQSIAAYSFELRVQDIINAGAKDRDTAIRWLHDAYDTQGDDEFLCYHLGLPYGYFKSK